MNFYAISGHFTLFVYYLLYSYRKLLLSIISYTELWLLLFRRVDWCIACFTRSYWHNCRDYVHLFPQSPERIVIMQFNN